MRDCEALAENMSAYHKLYNTLEGSFDDYELNYIARANNTEADELENIGSTRGPRPPGVFLKSINQRSIKTKPPTPEAAAEDNDTSEPAQVASTSQVDETGNKATEEAKPAAHEE